MPVRTPEFQRSWLLEESNDYVEKRQGDCLAAVVGEQ